jgi:hypothetical protein
VEALSRLLQYRFTRKKGPELIFSVKTMTA